MKGTATAVKANGSPAKKRKTLSLSAQENLLGYAFVAPALAFMIFFVAYPIIYNFIMSLQLVDVTTLTKPDKEFIGLTNYINIFTQSTPMNYLWNSFEKTMIYTVECIVFQFTIGFFFAVMYTQKAKKLKGLSGLMLLSYILPASVCSILFKFMFWTNGGIVNEILKMCGIINAPVEWLTTPNNAMWSVVIANIWNGIPFNMILIVSGLVTISNDVYESATIDGANAWQQFTKITVPLLKPAIKMVLVLGFIYTFKCFELIYAMTSGGPTSGTELMTIYAYRRAFMEFNFSEGAAISNILLLILMVVGLLYTRMLKDEEVG
jgi:multiple sugar transport system permease protein